MSRRLRDVLVISGNVFDTLESLRDYLIKQDDSQRFHHELNKDRPSRQPPATSGREQKKPDRTTTPAPPGGGGGSSYNHYKPATPATDTTCYNCGEEGHMASRCPKKDSRSRETTARIQELDRTPRPKARRHASESLYSSDSGDDYHQLHSSSSESENK